MISTPNKPASRVMGIAKATILAVSLGLPASSIASLSWLGNGYIELSTSQTSPNYSSVGNVTPNTGSGFDLGNLQSVAQGQTLFLGAQIQTWPQQNGNATLFYRIGTSGGYSSINLAYYQYSGNNNWWDSNGNINSSHSFSSANINNSLSPNTYTVDFYFSATDTDNNITMIEGTSSNPYSFSFTVTAVPEPITVALPVFGAAFMAFRWIRRSAGQQAKSAF